MITASFTPKTQADSTRVCVMDLEIESRWKDMATIQSSVSTFDRMTTALQSVTSTASIVVSSFENVQRAADQSLNATRVQEYRVEFSRTQTELLHIEDSIRRVREQEDNLNGSTEEGEKKAYDLKEAWEKVSDTLGKIGISVNPADIFAQANEFRMAGNTVQAQTGMEGGELEAAKQSVKNLYTDNMGEDLNDVAQSLSTVYQITRRTGAGLEQMTRAGMLLKDTFGFDVAESVKTAEAMEKRFGIAGGQAFDLIVQGAQAGLDQNGSLLDTINEYSPHFQKLGLDSADMFNMFINGSQNGVASVDQVGEAVKEFYERTAGGDEGTKEGFEAIGLDAEKMWSSFGSGRVDAKAAFQETVAALNSIDDPVKQSIAGASLFGSAWEDLGAQGVLALSSLNGSVELTTDNLEALNRVRYDDATSALASLGRTVNMGLAGLVGNAVGTVTNYISQFTAGLQGNVGEAQGIFGRIGMIAGAVGGMISESWSVLEPVIWGIVAALGVYHGTMALTNGIGVISQGINYAIAIAKMIHMAMTRKLTETTAEETTAQLGLNSAMLACPLTWIIIAIIAVIAILYAAVALINKLAGTSISATGIICGVFAVAGAAIANVLMGVLSIGLGVVEFLVNGWMAFANFFSNVFRDPVGSIIHLFADMGDMVLGVIEKIAEAIDFVFGSNLAGAVSGWRDGLAEMADQAAERFGNGEYENKLDKFDAGKALEEAGFNIERFEYGSSFDGAYRVGEKGEKKFTEFFKDIKLPFGDGFDYGEAQERWEGIDNNTVNTADNTAKMADSMDVLDEDLKYMRDAAEQEIINRFTLADLKIDVNNNNTLTSKTDFDDLGRVFEEVTNEIIFSAAEGAY